jgi:hypothetical protein
MRSTIGIFGYHRGAQDMRAIEQVVPAARLRTNVTSRNSDRAYTVRRALNIQTRRDAYELRHASYLNSGYIDPRPDRLFSDKFDLLPSSHTVVVHEDEKPVASVRVCFLSSDNIDAAPAGIAHPDEVGELLAGLPKYPPRPQAVEITRLVRSPAAENNQGLVFLLLRLAGYFALQEDVQLLMSCVRQNHVPFYRRLGCDTVSDLRPYPGLKFSTQLLACPRKNYDEARAAFPVLDPMAGPPNSFDGFMSGRPVSMPLCFRE